MSTTSRPPFPLPSLGKPHTSVCDLNIRNTREELHNFMDEFHCMLSFIFRVIVKLIAFVLIRLHFCYSLHPDEHGPKLRSHLTHISFYFTLKPQNSITSTVSTPKWTNSQTSSWWANIHPYSQNYTSLCTPKWTYITPPNFSTFFLPRIYLHWPNIFTRNQHLPFQTFHHQSEVKSRVILCTTKLESSIVSSSQEDSTI